MHRLQPTKYTLILLSGLYLGTFAMISAISWHRASFFKNHIENFSATERAHVFALFCILLAIYAIGAYAVRALPVMRLSTIFFAVFPIVLMMLFTPPFLSRDTAIYAAKAKNFAQFHYNPYEPSPVDAVWRDEISDLWWMRFSSFYGPLFNIYMIPFGAMPHASATTVILLYKLCSATIFIFSILLIEKLRTLMRAPPAVTLLYALNPALLIHATLEGHNDMIVLFFILLAAYFLMRARATPSMISLAASVAVKYITLILLPLFWIQRGRFKWKPVAISIGMVALFFAFSTAPFGFPFHGIAEGIDTQNNLACLYDCTPYTYLTNRIFSAAAHTARAVSFMLAYLWCLYYFLIKKYEPIKFSFWALFTLVFIYASWVTPWYPILLIPLALLYARAPLYEIAAYLLTAYSLLSYFRL